MIKFLIGYLVGGIIGFLAAAVLSVNHTEKESTQPLPSAKKQEITAPETTTETTPDTES